MLAWVQWSVVRHGGVGGRVDGTPASTSRGRDFNLDHTTPRPSRTRCSTRTSSGAGGEQRVGADRLLGRVQDDGLTADVADRCVQGCGHPGVLEERRARGCGLRAAGVATVSTNRSYRCLEIDVPRQAAGSDGVDPSLVHGRSSTGTHGSAIRTNNVGCRPGPTLSVGASRGRPPLRCSGGSPGGCRAPSSRCDRIR